MWTIEDGVYDTDPATQRPVAVLRIWRMHPPPWKLVAVLPYHQREVVDALVQAHNEEVLAAGEVPQLGLVPRWFIADTLRRTLQLHRPRKMYLEWLESFIQWLEDQERKFPTRPLQSSLDGPMVEPEESS